MVPQRDREEQCIRSRLWGWRRQEHHRHEKQQEQGHDGEGLRDVPGQHRWQEHACRHIEGSCRGGGACKRCEHTRPERERRAHTPPEAPRRREPCSERTTDGEAGSEAAADARGDEWYQRRDVEETRRECGGKGSGHLERRRRAAA